VVEILLVGLCPRAARLNAWTQNKKIGDGVAERQVAPNALRVIARNGRIHD
jgi:hypothetical protein